jgi:phosphoglycerate dehydrogenase-like enzyme
MKVLLHYRASPDFRRALAHASQAAGFQSVVVDEADTAALERELVDTDVVLHVLKPFTAAMMAMAPRLKLVQKIGVGVNTIDLEAARARGICVCNMPGSNSRAVAEMTLSLMLAVLRKTVWLDRKTRDGQGWSLDLAAVDSFGEIGGRTVGLVGFGSIPQALTPVLEALGAKVIYTARHPNPDRRDAFRPLNDLLAEADIVSLHVPLSDQTRGMIGADAFERMREGAILINTARGELVDEGALAAALQSAKLRGAGLDVFIGEPIGAHHPLAALETVVMTPHVAWLTPETLRRSLDIATQNAGRLERGDDLLHRVI